MKLARLKLIAFISLLTAFIVSVILMYVYYNDGSIINFDNPDGPNEFALILKKVIGVYSVQLSVAIASYFSVSYRATTRKAAERHYIAFLLIILWIIGFVTYILINGIYLPTGRIKFNDLYKDFDTITITFNFLISAAIVFLFAESPKKETVS